MEILPAIDLMSGSAVRLTKGEFDSRETYSSDPTEVLKGFIAEGARNLHVVDLDGARYGSPVNFPTIKALAATVQNALNKLNSEKTGRTYSALGGDYYILNCTSYPAAIVECGFLSNPEDEKLLTDDGYRLTLASAVARAVNEYISVSLG